MLIEEHETPLERAEIKVGVDASCCVWIIANTSNGHFANVRFTNKEALEHASTVVNAVNQIHRDCGLREYELRQVPAPSKPDPRPADMSELANMVAKTLRNVPVNAIAEFSTVYVLRVLKRDPNAFVSPTYWHPWTMYLPLFDNLAPLEIVAVIQAEEVKQAAKWAGDK